MEQLNIVGKRSGEGFVAHKAMLANALSRAMADRLELLDFTIGRKGLLNYLRALGGSNIVKVVPATDGSASGAQAAAKKLLKVVCGAHTSYLKDMAWIGDKTPLTFAEVRISPDNSVMPNVGSVELAEALGKVLPFTSRDKSAPVFQCVLFRAKEGKLTLASTDGFRLATVVLDYDQSEGEVLINRDELKGIPVALRKAKRARLAIEPSGETLNGMTLVIDTEVVRYGLAGEMGSFPNYEQVIPKEFATLAHFDSVEAIKAIKSFRALSANPKDYPIDLTIGNGSIIMTDPEKTGEVVIKADTDGEVRSARLDGRYFAEALKACGGMLDLKLTTSITSPVIFASDGCQVAVMPIITEIKAAQAKEPAKGEAPAPVEAEAAAVAEAEEVIKGKGKGKVKRSPKKEPVAVA